MIKTKEQMCMDGLNLHDSDILELLDLVREHGKNPDLWFKLSDMISTDVEETEYVIVWQDEDFNYRQVTGSRVFTSYADAEKVCKSLYGKTRGEVMRKRDFDYLQKQINETS
jgi:hypothetical protein